MRIGPLFALLFFSAADAFAQNMIAVNQPLNMSFRQLMLDDRVMVSAENVEKIYSELEKSERVLLEPTEPHEKAQNCIFLYGSVLHDLAGLKYKMWYQVIYGTEKREAPFPYTYATCYAESHDGLTWVKPELDNVDYFGDEGANNIVMEKGAMPHVFLEERDSEYRFRFFWPHPHRVGLSKNGRRIERVQNLRFDDTIPNSLNMRAATGRFISDGNDVMYDPVDEIWRGVFKTWAPLASSVVPTLFRRSQAVATSKDGLNWTFTGRIITVDVLDDAYVQTQRAGVKRGESAWAELYVFPHFRYEGLLIGLPCVFYQSADLYEQGGEDAEVFLAWSYDGDNWHRPRVRQPLLRTGPEGGSDDGFLVTQCSPPLRQENELWIYYTANPHRHTYPYKKLPDADQMTTFRRGTLRVDGWAGYRAGAKEGVIETEHFPASGVLRVNADCRQGELRVEVVEVTGMKYGKVTRTTSLDGFGKSDSAPVSGDVFEHAVRWKRKAWSELKGKKVRLRFHLRNATLYSFWTSDD